MARHANVISNPAELHPNQVYGGLLTVVLICVLVMFRWGSHPDLDLEPGPGQLTPFHPNGLDAKNMDVSVAPQVTSPPNPIPQSHSVSLTQCRVNQNKREGVPG